MDLSSVLDAIAGSVSIVTPFSAIVGGQLITTEGRHPQNADSGEQTIVRRITDELYRRYYCTGGDPSLMPSNGAMPVARSRSIVGDLSSANPGANRWSAGWKVARIDADGRVLVHRDGWFRSVSSGAYLLRGGMMRRAAVGDEVSVYRPRETIDPASMFYFAHSARLIGDSDAEEVVRFYLSVAAHRAPALLEHLVTILNRYSCAFTMKCPASTEHYWRKDAFVIYVPRPDAMIACRLIANIHDGFDFGDCRGTPLFAKPVRSSCAWAEDPGAGVSFGQHRSRILAEGLFGAYARREESREKKVRSMHAAFEAAGVDIARAHRRQGSMHAELGE